MSSEYRRELIKAGIVNYWNRKSLSKNVGLFNCLRQIDTKLDLKLDEKREVHAAYFNHLFNLSKEESINKMLRNKAIVNSSEITRFWESKKEKTYRKTLDEHTRREKEYLSSLHLAQLQDEDNKKERETDKDEVDKDDVDKDEDDKDDVDKDDVDKDENDKDDVDKDEDDKDKDGGSLATMNGDIFVPDEGFKFVERHEPDTISRTKRWILSSGTDVGQVLDAYRCLIPESEKCVNPVYWGILDLTGTHPETKQLFSTEDWTEMLKSFEDEIETIEENIPDVVYLFFDEIEQIIKNNERSEDIVTKIDGISSQKIEAKYEITLDEQDKDYIFEIKRAVLTYAENLADVDLPVSESAFDNSFTNMLTRRFLDKSELKMDSGEICSWASAQRRNEGRSITLRARVGQKCDFRGTLKHSINKLEAITGLRSGGLPEPHRKKIFLDSLDLSITMRDILHAFFNSNANASDEDLHKIFVLGVQSWGWTHKIVAMDCKGTNICRYGKLCTTALPNSIRTLACLEKFYVEMKNVKATLNYICNKANNIALSHARAHRRKRKGKNREEHANIEVGGCFGKITGTPYSKKSRILEI
ncbi:23003_t:CDS:2 [Cetraspora pellucida]|uniref:23003_t:CDS:1 n=1 Tax=Cetraspora pellucida TaxID=1433469 RepID=A0A9N9G918_9GLOM|nr:23003_t:CDS:2 [Cetraspora pellucida]